MIFLATSVYGQRLGVKAGLNLSEMCVKDNSKNYSEDFTLRPGYNVGLFAELPMTDMLRFETGLNLNSKGYNFEGPLVINDRTFIVKEKVHLNYLDLPLNVKAYHMGDNLDVYGAAGVYLGMGLSGKMDREVNVDGDMISEDRRIDFGSSDNDDLKRFDFGINLGAGIEISDFVLGANYGIGLVNVLPNSVNGSKATNRVLSISVGYMFP